MKINIFFDCYKTIDRYLYCQILDKQKKRINQAVEPVLEDVRLILGREGPHQEVGQVVVFAKHVLNKLGATVRKGDMLSSGVFFSWI